MNIDGIESPPDKRRQERTITYLTQEEVRRLFSVIKNKRDRAIFAVAYRHGLRASEVGLLQRTDVDLKQGAPSLSAPQGLLLWGVPHESRYGKAHSVLPQGTHRRLPIPIPLQPKAPN